MLCISTNSINQTQDAVKADMKFLYILLLLLLLSSTSSCVENQENVKVHQGNIWALFSTNCSALTAWLSGCIWASLAVSGLF